MAEGGVCQVAGDAGAGGGVCQVTGGAGAGGVVCQVAGGGVWYVKGAGLGS